MGSLPSIYKIQRNYSLARRIYILRGLFVHRRETGFKTGPDVSGDTLYFRSVSFGGFREGLFTIRASSSRIWFQDYKNGCRQLFFAQTEICYSFAVQFIGSLAQLVQSICLTSRGSGVRTPQLPLDNQPLTKNCEWLFYLQAKEQGRSSG